MNDNPTLIFAIVVFCLGAVLIWQREYIPQKLKKPLAIFAALMILFAFGLIVYTFFALGT
ncbi:hypothetical protein [Cohnella massiliensis]|uniref:hypothetical protein n=1 Tax=Cohnella massiliensis TaxID=1816691 RepID=UPI0009BAE916|nr:hypothetical protein [Cohnella massiliensis]